jgi:prepilin-type N-terminal cleavage/methylation domain-containing protein
MKKYQLLCSTPVSGFTLVELLVTIAILALLLAVGAPALTSFVSSSNSTNAVRLLSTSLAYARSEAVSRGDVVTVCGSTNGTACNVANWNSGWLVFRDTDGDALLDAGEEVLKVEDASQLSMTFAIVDDNSNAETFNAVQFNNLGEVSNVCATVSLPVSCAVDNAFVSFTASSNGESSSIQLSRTGAVGAY